MSDIELTERELQVAKAAAKLAVREMQDEFYRQVGKSMVTRVLVWIGKSMVTRVLVWIGIASVAFAAGKGWIPKT